jgi:hypothetical protein
MDLIADLNECAHDLGDSVHRLFVDFTVTHPCAASYIDKAAAKSSYAASSAAQKKQLKYSAAVNDATLGWKFVPLAVESFGCLDTGAVDLLRALSNVVSLDHASDEAVARGRLIDRWMCRLSCALQKANARLILHRVMPLIRQDHPCVGAGIDISDLLCRDHHDMLMDDGMGPSRRG